MKPIFTKREIEVMKLLASGNTNKQIARRIHLTSKTIEYHRSNIYQKLDVTSVAALIQRVDLLGINPRPELLDAGPDLVWRGTIDGTLTFVSSNVKTITGYERQEILYLKFSDWGKLWFSESYFERVKLSLARRARGDYGDGPIAFEAEFKRRDGSYYKAEVHSEPIFGDDGLIIGVKGSNRLLAPLKKEVTI